MLRRISQAVVFAFLVALPASAQYFEEGLAAYNRGDYQAALGGLRPLAQKGEARAQHYLAFMYLRGKGVPQSDVEAAVWFQKAARQGHAKSQYNLAVMYHIGLGVHQDDLVAAKWFREAAKQGHSEARQNLVFMREKGRRITTGTSPAPIREGLRSQLAAIKSLREESRRVATKAPSPHPPKDLPAKVNVVMPLPEQASKTPTPDNPAPLSSQLSAAKSIPNKDLPAATLAPLALAPDTFLVQLGAVKLKARAEKEAGRLNKIHKVILGDLKIVPVRSDLGKKGIYYRLRTGPFDGWSAAKSFCRKLATRKQGCIVANR